MSRRAIRWHLVALLVLFALAVVNDAGMMP